MQNCLQSNRKRKTWARFITVLSLTIAVLTATLFMRAGNDTVFGGNTDSAAAMKMSDATIYLNAEYKLNEDEKMNNGDLENAKKLVSDSKVGKPFDVLNEPVDVLTDGMNVVSMNLEDYVAGCVFGEMPMSFEPQALMAQCVAVRSFTVRQMTMGTSKHKNADVCTDSGCCQNFAKTESMNEIDKRKLFDAVSATRGIIMTYDDMPIEAVYHASSGEYTLSSEDVWGGRVEYLRSVPSPEGEAELTSVLYGHRVGMSQHGANLLAKEGMNYIDILKYYYSGISFSFL